MIIVMTMENKKFTFGQVRKIDKNAEETREIVFTLSTATRDAHHTVLNQNGWDLERYKKNPVIGYMHNLYGDLCSGPDPDAVIGRTSEIWIESANERGLNEDLALRAVAAFEPAEINVLAEKVFRKLLFGSLNAASVGFMEKGKGRWGDGEEAQGRENETYYFAGQELLEWSVVNIPSNPDGVKRAMREQTATALAYAHRALGGRFRLSQIENMRVRDVLDLLDGKDIEIRETDPEKVRKMLEEIEAKKAIDTLIENQMKIFRKKAF